MGRISIICDDFEEGTLQGIEAAMSEMPSGRIASQGSPSTAKADKSNTHSKWIDIEKLKPIINENIQSIISLIDEKPLADKDYEVSELEFNIAIQGETSVSILSVVSAGVSAHSGITVRIRKK